MLFIGEFGERIYLDKRERVIQHPTFYIKSLTRNPRFSSNTIHQYAKSIHYFCEYVQELGGEEDYLVDELLGAIDGDHIDQYFTRLKQEGIGASTIRNRDVAIKGFMEWLTSIESGAVRAESGYVKGKLKSAASKKKIPRYLTKEEIIQFINFLHDESQRCLVQFMFDCGVRISEVPLVKKSDIPNLSNYPEDQMYFDLYINGSKGRGGERKPRYTLITRAMIQRINLLHNNWKTYIKSSVKLKDPPCFLNMHGNPLTGNAIKTMLRDAALRNNLEPKKYSPHKFRHSFAVSILKSEHGNDRLERLVLAKEALGHEDIKTTEMYITIPLPVLENMKSLDEAQGIKYRFEESQEIFERTYKPQKFHTEKRGRRKGR
ncbi:tyrosine-type recombinase/integrase [Paenibacillus ferrarius]|uniref:tyrosine-type recombinase/integrase n=1 Tax=Paenibacillus ferrarius TaxID=1469647 RepID=UPI003D29EB7E